MPWLSIIMAIISALVSLKKNPDKKGQAVAAAALGGLGTYYITHETEWGRDLFGKFDGVVATPPIAAGDSPRVLADGSVIGAGQTNTPRPDNGNTTGIWDTLKGWGPTGTALVVGTTGALTSSKVRKYLPWIIGGGLFLLLTADRRKA